MVLVFVGVGCIRSEDVLGSGRQVIDAGTESGNGEDGGPFDADAHADVLADAASPLPFEFGDPVPLAEINDPAAVDDDPCVRADGLELFFNSDRPGAAGNGDIWRAVRMRVDEPWGPPAPVAELNSTRHDATPTLSLDGLRIWFSSNRDGSLGGRDIWVADRASLDAAWSAPRRVIGLSSEGNEYAPRLSADGLWMLLTAGDVEVDTDIWSVARPAVDMPWLPPAVVAGLSGPGLQAEAAPIENGRYIILSAESEGQTDLFLAVRDARGEYPDLVPLERLNSAADEMDPWPDWGLQYIVFASSRGGTKDLYEAPRLR